MSETSDLPAGTEASKTVRDSYHELMVVLARRGEIVMVICTMIYACQAVLAKVVERRIPAMQLVAFRSSVAGLGTLIASARRIRNQRRLSGGVAQETPPGPAVSWTDGFLGPPEVRVLCACRGVSGATAFALLYAAYPYLALSEHVSVQFTAPLFIGLLAVPVLGEALAWVDAAAMTLAFAGTLLVVQPPFLPGAPWGEGGNDGGGGDLSHPPHTPPAQLRHGRSLGLGLCLAGAVMSAVAMVNVRLIGKRVASPFVLATWFHGSSCLLGLGGLALGLQQAVVPTAHELALLCLVSATSFVGQLSLNYAYQTLPAAVAGTLSYLQLVWQFGLGLTVLHEPFRWTSGAGASLIAIGGILGKLMKPPLPPTPLKPQEGTLWGAGGEGVVMAGQLETGHSERSSASSSTHVYSVVLDDGGGGGGGDDETGYLNPFRASGQVGFETDLAVLGDGDMAAEEDDAADSRSLLAV